VRRKVLLEVKVSNNNVSGRREELTELIVENNLAAVLGMLETLLSDVLVNELGDFGTGDEISFGKSEKLAQLRCDFLLSVEAVVLSARLSLLTIGIFLGVLDLAYELSEVLYIVAEGGNFGLDGFERHYIYLTELIFKSRRKRPISTTTHKTIMNCVSTGLREVSTLGCTGRSIYLNG
tara:strand:+ start:1505 stop:2038 length:534 start_codon:yes stop_codon:yes gene_type:complete